MLNDNRVRQIRFVENMCQKLNDLGKFVFVWGRQACSRTPEDLGEIVDF
jgi:hypothetical protein